VHNRIIKHMVGNTTLCSMAIPLWMLLKGGTKALHDRRACLAAEPVRARMHMKWCTWNEWCTWNDGHEMNDAHETMHMKWCTWYDGHEMMHMKWCTWYDGLKMKRNSKLLQQHLQTWASNVACKKGRISIYSPWQNPKVHGNNTISPWQKLKSPISP
jgi:hypothetical protein